MSDLLSRKDAAWIEPSIFKLLNLYRPGDHPNVDPFCKKAVQVISFVANEHKITISDSKHQIDAFLTKKAIENLENLYPDLFKDSRSGVKKLNFGRLNLSMVFLIKFRYQVRIPGVKSRGDRELVLLIDQ